MDFLKSKNIDIIRGMPYNPHSQGSVERLHQTLKKSLSAVYNEYLSDNNNKENLILKVKLWLYVIIIIYFKKLNYEIEKLKAFLKYSILLLVFLFLSKK